MRRPRSYVIFSICFYKYTLILLDIKHFFCAKESATRLMRVITGGSGQELIYCQNSQFHYHHSPNKVVTM